jgi:radical SAM protein with 4Fe4S-binding SPASM domain
LEKDNFKVIKRVLSEIKKINSLKIVTVTGGEPTLSPYFEYVIDKLYDYGKFIVITTNGVISKANKIASFLKKYRDWIQVQISIEGGKKIHEYFRGRGTFEKVISTTKTFVKNKIPTSFMVTLFNSFMMKQLDQVIKLGEKIGVSFISFERFIPTGRGTPLFTESVTSYNFYKFWKKIKILQKKGYRVYINDPICSINSNGIGCSAGISVLSIDPKGNVYPCSKLRIPVGNVMSSSLIKIWKKSPLLKRLRNRNNLKGKCSSCRYKWHCGGCRALAFSLKKSLFEEDPSCFIKK